MTLRHASPQVISRWLGLVIPKRHARRSVTRSLLKRQIRAAAARRGPNSAQGLWVVRLRAPSTHAPSLGRLGGAGGGRARNWRSCSTRRAPPRNHERAPCLRLAPPAAARADRFWCAATACCLSPWLGSLPLRADLLGLFARSPATPRRGGQQLPHRGAHPALPSLVPGRLRPRARPGAHALPPLRRRRRGTAFTLVRQDLPMTDFRRTLLWVVFSMSLVLIWDAWQRHNGHPSMFSPAPAKPPPRHRLLRWRGAQGSRAGRRGSQATPAPRRRHRPLRRRRRWLSR